MLQGVVCIVKESVSRAHLLRVHFIYDYLPLDTAYKQQKLETAVTKKGRYSFSDHSDLFNDFGLAGFACFIQELV